MTSASRTALARTVVIHLIHTMAYGGVETAVINWVRKIDRTKFDVRLVCFANPGGTETPFVEAAEKSGIAVSKIPWSRRKPLFKSSRALTRLARECNADIIHTHNCYADCVGVLTARMVPVKIITTLYVWADLDWKRNLIQLVNQYALHFFDQITAHCEDTLRRTVARGFKEEQVKTLICGFETQRVEMSEAERLRRRRDLGVEDYHLLLVNVARLYPEKTQDSLLRIFKSVRERCPDARLWIVGVGPLEARLRALCTELELDSAVTFVGFVNDLPSLLPLADIQVHPAQIEGVPLAICSGMAAGLPIIASEVGGLPEILNHGRCGVLVPLGDEPKFTEAILELIENRERARQLGSAARHFIENDYSLAAAVKRVEQTYHEVLGLCDSASSS